MGKGDSGLHDMTNNIYNQLLIMKVHEQAWQERREVRGGEGAKIA